MISYLLFQSDTHFHKVPRCSHLNLIHIHYELTAFIADASCKSNPHDLKE